MSLTPSQRARLKTEVARRMSPRTWAEIDLVLEEFGAEVSSSWSGDPFSYVLAMLRLIPDDMLTQLAVHENIEMGIDSIMDAPSFWADGQLRVFLSHISAHKLFASELQKSLSKYGVCAFVAHEDIEPTAEWQDEIEKALRTCDALVALLNPDFNKSTWTDQEVGYALGRGAPVFSVRLGMSPYGLFGRKQAFNGNSKTAPEIARELFDAYRNHPKTAEKMADGIVERFISSNSYSAAIENVGLVEELSIWKTAYNSRLTEALEGNDQVQRAWGVKQRVSNLIAKHASEQGSNVSTEDVTF